MIAAAKHQGFRGQSFISEADLVLSVHFAVPVQIHVGVRHHAEHHINGPFAFLGQCLRIGQVHVCHNVSVEHQQIRRTVIPGRDGTGGEVVAVPDGQGFSHFRRPVGIVQLQPRDHVGGIYTAGQYHGVAEGCHITVDHVLRGVPGFDIGLYLAGTYIPGFNGFRKVHIIEFFQIGCPVIQRIIAALAGLFAAGELEQGCVFHTVQGVGSVAAEGSAVIVGFRQCIHIGGLGFLDGFGFRRFRRVCSIGGRICFFPLTGCHKQAGKQTDPGDCLFHKWYPFLEKRLFLTEPIYAVHNCPVN